VTELIDKLTAQGIRPHGSQALSLYEQRLTRYFSREYRSLADSDTPLADYGIHPSLGPMWQRTDELMAEHYDESVELFDAFLDRRFKAYSMAYYGESPNEIRDSCSTLEQAQEAKLRLIVARAGVRGNERVLSIGCGFGPLETYLLAHWPDLSITSITPSRVQANYIRRCMQDPQHPLSARAMHLIEGDFGAIPVAELGAQRHDLVFAVGMFEHVHNLAAAFGKIGELLRPGGRAFLHLIVSRPAFPQFMDSKDTLVGRYFPGGRIWPFREIPRHAHGLDLEGSWYLNGLNYWRTLDEWHWRFWAGMEDLAGRVLSEAAIRYWNDYFSLCKVVLFAPLEGAVYGNGHYLFRKQAGTAAG